MPQGDEVGPLESWAHDLIEGVYDEWREHYQDWNGGVKVFYSPVRKNPGLLILGYQPGGEEFQRKERFEAGQFHTPPKHRLLDHDYRLAKQMRRLFEGRHELLEDSVYSNLIFFRSPEIDAWESQDPDRVEAAESFCLSKNREIIETLDPDNVFLIGVETFDRFVEAFSDLMTSDISTVNREQGRVLCSAQMGARKVVGIKHISGARISAEEWEILEDQLWDVLDLS